MLDLKAKLAAAGVVTAEQVKKFDEKEEKKREQKARKQQARQKKGAKPGKKSGGKNPAGPKARPIVNVQHLQSLKKGEAYDRLRKVVAQRRLDEAERTIPKEDEVAFNFVTAQGKIGKLYLKEELITGLRNGKLAISSFMSHHGLAHCVLPSEIAVDIAKVFPLWLRHHHGNEEAGKLAEKEEPKKIEDKQSATGSEGDSPSAPSAASEPEAEPTDADPNDGK